ncbi:MAG TPA: SCO family protein [Alphaproteobacteria bacterium]|nr:SCO family protein [Alphaproteobacteria bacterium]
MLKWTRMIAWGLVGAFALATPIWLLSRTPVTQRTLSEGTLGAPFVLQSSKGGAFDSAQLKGRPYALFFGFTYCPDICPTTVAELSNHLEALGPAAQDFKVLFVSVDPARDTPEVLKDFLSNFDPRIIGLTGTTEQIESVTQAYAAYAKRVALDGGNYTMDHSASVFLFDGKGQLVSTLDFKEKPAVKLEKLKMLLARE